ncbi:unnamed protein product [Parajaminaea phylloscopi]
MAPRTVFANATVFTGNEHQARFIGTVIIEGQDILEVQPGSQDLADLHSLTHSLTHTTTVVDCQDGKWAICPGFIDMHAHSELSLLHTPDHLAKVTQGVTLEVLGQDGISYAPVTDETLPTVRNQIAGWNGKPTDESFWRWRSVAEYLDTLDEARIATNAAYLVPQGNLRMLVLGYSPRAATQTEVEAMQDILRQGLAQGAVGMSSGLTYVPGMYAPDSELAHLLRVVAEHGGYYCPHHRSYGKGAMQAYREMIDLAKQTRVRLHLTHATLNFSENKGRGPELLTLIDEALAEGVEITLDTYPYLPGSTTLAALLPSWAAEGGGGDAVLRRLRDPEQCRRLRHDVEVVGTDGCHGCTLEWDTIEISGLGSGAPADLKANTVGKTVAQIARDRQVAPWDAFVDLLVRDELQTTILQHVGHEDNVRTIMRHPTHTGGSDGILTSMKPHPRGWGTFARYMGHYGRDLVLGKERQLYLPTPDDLDSYAAVEPVQIFAGGLEEVVAHLTSRPARIVGCDAQRGTLEAGKKADLVVFDPAEICDVATFAAPERAAKGIRHVVINGQFAVHEGKPTRVRAGKTLRSDGRVSRSGRLIAA